MKYKQGIKLALVTALISGVAVFFNRFAVKAVGDALVFTTIKNLGVGLVVALWLGTRQIEWKKISKRDWVKLGLIGIIGGSLPFYLFFKGLMIADSANAALIHKLLVFMVALWAVPVLKERVSLKQLGALGLIFSSNLVIGGLGRWQWGAGEWMILGATVLWAIENVMAKIVLKQVQVEVVVGARMILGSMLLVLGVGMSGKIGLVTSLGMREWGLVLMSAGLLFGYVMSWYRALKIAPVTLVATVLSLGAVVSNVLSAIFITHSLNLGLIYQSILLMVGVWFFVIWGRKNEGIAAVC